MNDSVELLSSMSPKIKVKLKPGEKQFRKVKGASILALRRSMGKSSVYVATESNVDLNIVEKGSTESQSAQYNFNLDDLEFHSTEEVIENNEDTVIEISDTDSSSSSIDHVQEPKKQITTEPDIILPKDKLDAISNWVEKVNVENEASCSVYSELSTICGSENNFIKSNNGHAVNSTFYNGCNKKFDQFFIKKNNHKVNESSSTNTDDIIDNSMKNLVIEDSFEIMNQSLKSRLQITDDVENEKKEVKTYNTEIKEDTVLINNKEDSQEIQENCNVEDVNALKLLDKLYGNSWRANSELILSKTEPRKNIKPPAIKIVASEKKPKESLLYKNPYLDTEKSKSQVILNTVHKIKTKQNAKSPWLERLKYICDSDSDTDNSPAKIKSTKLKFDDESSPNETDKTTSKYFKNKDNSSNKENDINQTNKAHLLNDKMQYVTKRKPFKKFSDSENSDKDWFSLSSSDSASDANTNFKTQKKDKIVSSVREISSSSEDEEWNAEVSRIERKVEKTCGSYSFLASLSEDVPNSQCDATARIFKSNFKKYKNELVKKLFDLYNDKVFDNVLPKDLPIEWNDRMRKSAGFCYCKKIIRRNGGIERSARIALSSKVLDRADRLRDTLIHEMCHAVTWIANCVQDGHGDYWKSWAFKAMKTFPELPIIKRCHSYVISTKYTYRCTVCSYSFGRHSKSLDLERKRCGYCHGKFEVLINKTNKKGETKAVLATPKKEATGFALFVKENYGSYKIPERKHADVMKILGQKFQEMKVEHK